MSTVIQNTHPVSIQYRRSRRNLVHPVLIQSLIQSPSSPSSSPHPVPTSSSTYPVPIQYLSSTHPVPIQSSSSPAGAAEISCIQSSSSPWRYWMGTGWVLDEYWMGTGCVFEGYWIGIGWVLDGYWMSPSSPHPVPPAYLSSAGVGIDYFFYNL